MCPAKGCPSHRKSIRRERLEGEFEGVLERLEPYESVFKLARMMFKDIWNARLAQIKEARKVSQGKLRGIEKQIDQVPDRIVEASNQSVIAAYAKKIAQLEREKLLAEDELHSVGKPGYTLEESFELAFRFLSSPCYVIKNHSLKRKETVLGLAFSEPISYCRIQGGRTPEIAIPVKPLADLSTGKCEMAHLKGICSNAPFAALEDWERHHASIDFKNLRCENDNLRP